MYGFVSQLNIKKKYVGYNVYQNVALCNRVIDTPKNYYATLMSRQESHGGCTILTSRVKTYF